MGHDPTDERWWGVKYLEKGPLPRPGRCDVSQRRAHRPPFIGCALASLDNTGIGIGYRPTSRKATRCWSLPVLENRCVPLSFVHRFTESSRRLQPWHPANAGVHAHHWPSFNHPVLEFKQGFADGLLITQGAAKPRPSVWATHPSSSRRPDLGCLEPQHQTSSLEVRLAEYCLARRVHRIHHVDFTSSGSSSWS